MRPPREHRAQFRSSKTFCLSMRRRQKPRARVAEMPALLSCKRREENVPGPLANMLQSKGKTPRVQAQEVRVLPTHYLHRKRPRRALRFTLIDLITLHLRTAKTTRRQRVEYVKSATSFCVALVKDYVQDASCSNRLHLSKILTIAYSIPLELHRLKSMPAFRSSWSTVSLDPAFSFTFPSSIYRVCGTPFVTPQHDWFPRSLQQMVYSGRFTEPLLL